MPTIENKEFWHMIEAFISALSDQTIFEILYLGISRRQSSSEDRLSHNSETVPSFPHSHT